MSAPLANVRKDLENFWTKQKIDEIKSAYRNAEPRAFDDGKYAKCLQDVFDSGQAGPAAYRKCAREAGLAKTLHNLWSTKS